MALTYRATKSGAALVYAPVEYAAPTRTSVSSALDASYSICAFVSADLAASWAIRAYVEAGLSADYGIAALVSADLATAYAIVSSAAPPGDLIYVSPSCTVNFDGGTNRVNFDGGTNRVDF